VYDHAPEALQRARKLRKEMSLPEATLWRLLKAKPLGLKFRKQHPLGDFVVDFLCYSARMVFEIDGISHDMGDQPQFDLQRDIALSALGYTVVRIAAVDVLKDPEAVAESIVRYCLAASPAGEGPTGAPH
jgi:very-short-patch-repair endonuclease